MLYIPLSSLALVWQSRTPVQSSLVPIFRSVGFSPHTTCLPSGPVGSVVLHCHRHPPTLRVGLHWERCSVKSQRFATAGHELIRGRVKHSQVRRWLGKEVHKMVDGNSDGGVYRVKNVQVEGKDVSIVLQNENGPCPLLAIANVLLLREELKLEPHTVNLSHERLVSMVAGNLLDRYKGVDDGNVQRNVHDAISVLPDIAKGLDVNVRFRDVKDFEFTKESAIFDLFGIDLVHGWLVDKKDMPLYEYIGSKSYNQLVEEIIASGIHERNEDNTERGFASLTSKSSISCLRDNPVECKLLCLQEGGSGSNTACVHFDVDSDDRVKVGMSEMPEGVKVHLREKTEEPVTSEARDLADAKAQLDLERAYAIDEFLNSSSQLTYSGLIQLHEKVEPDQYAVFFRNNHFSTITKHENSVFVLVTDQGYENKGSVVWEVLGEVDGDSQLMTGEFILWEAKNDGSDDRIDSGVNNANESSDFALAIALQEEENERIQAIAAAETEGATAHDARSRPDNRTRTEGNDLPVSTPASIPGDRRHRAGSNRTSRDKSKCVLM